MKKSAVVFLLLFSSHSAFAALFGDNTARQRIEELRQEVLELQNQVAQFESLRNNQINQVVTLQQLRDDMARLVGQIEVLNNQVEALTRQQRQFYADIDTRITALETGRQSAVIPIDNALSGQAGEETANFDAALRLFEAGQYSASSSAFQSFLQHYPESTLGPAAQFWIGHAFYAQKKDKEALAAYQKVIITWPTHPKSAEALLSIAMIYKDAKDTLNARRTLEALIARHPNTPSAQDARKMLNAL